MPQQMTSAQQETVGYWPVLWQNVIKIFFIDLVGASTVFCATSLVAMLLFAVAHRLWGLRFRTVLESLLILSAIYLAVIFVTAVKRHFSLGLAIKPILGPQPEVTNAKSAPVVDAGISTPVS
jgi:hypothetical protein